MEETLYTKDQVIDLLSRMWDLAYETGQADMEGEGATLMTYTEFLMYNNL